MAAKLDGTALGAIAVGTLFVYSGITGRSVLASVQTIVSGQSPSKLPNANPINGTGNPNATPVTPGAISGSVNGMAIAQAALRYAGHPYLFGGAPGPNGTNPWDCSSFVNWVLNHDFAVSLPGGAWNPNTHGPNTTSYMGWKGAQTITRANLAAGDLCIWPTHMGIALNNGQMISALNPRLGTQVTTIDGGAPGGESLVCRRVL